MRFDSPSRCRDDGEDVDARTGLCGFRRCDWSERFLDEHQATPSRPLFDPRRLVLGPPRVRVADECRALLQLQTLRDRRREVQIEAQARSSLGALLPLMTVLGLGEYYCGSSISLSNLIEDINQNIRPPAFVFKRLFLRARPSRMCSKLSPMFPRGDALHPGHPAYPSGHATMVYTWAYLVRAKLLSRHRAAHGDALMAAARAVAVNREWAGVHYASDTRAGQRLGKQMADAILAGRKLGKNDFDVLLPGLT